MLAEPYQWMQTVDHVREREGDDEVLMDTTFGVLLLGLAVGFPSEECEFLEVASSEVGRRLPVVAAVPREGLGVLIEHVGGEAKQAGIHVPFLSSERLRRR
jgi:hypothetical protein